jgi:hypothetical protein
MDDKVNLMRVKHWDQNFFYRGVLVFQSDGIVKLACANKYGRGCAADRPAVLIEIGTAIEIGIGAIGETFHPIPIPLSIAIWTGLACAAPQQGDASAQNLASQKSLESSADRTSAQAAAVVPSVPRGTATAVGHWMLAVMDVAAIAVSTASPSSCGYSQ